MSKTAKHTRKLRADLLQEQRALRAANRAMVILLEAPEHLSRAEVANLLGNWLDPRGVDFHAFREKSTEDEQHPRLWRYWRSLPAQGRIGVYVNGWYTGTLLNADEADLAQEDINHLARLREFERQLVREGVVVVKLWLSRSSEAQRDAITQAQPGDGLAWQTEPTDEQLLARRETLVRRAEAIMDHANSPAPWQTIAGDDADERNRRVGDVLLDSMRQAHKTVLTSDVDTPAPNAKRGPPPLQAVTDHPTLTKADYHAQLELALNRLKHLTWRAFDEGRSPILVFEGFDAAGKGGVIRRMLHGIDARLVSVFPIAAPNAVEQQYPYLWRFWRALPRAGDTAIFDRSWYGRVLVERVENLIDSDQCQWAYSEINDLEAQLIDAGHLVIKFWLHIDADEQLHRFHERERVPHKRHKIGPEDWRNREKRDAYVEAVNDMVRRTDRPEAPWHLIPANSKRFARIEIMRRISDHLAAMLEADNATSGQD